MNMKKIILMTTLFLGFTQSYAATEVSQNDTSKLKFMKEVTVTENTVNSCMDKISKIAEENGAKFFVIKNLSSIGTGSQAVVTGDLYTD